MNSEPSSDALHPFRSRSVNSGPTGQNHSLKSATDKPFTRCFAVKMNLWLPHMSAEAEPAHCAYQTLPLYFVRSLFSLHIPTECEYRRRCFNSSSNSIVESG